MAFMAAVPALMSSAAAAAGTAATTAGGWMAANQGIMALGSMAASTALSSRSGAAQVAQANSRQAAQNALVMHNYELSRNELSERIAQLNVDTGRAVTDLQTKAGTGFGSLAAMQGASGQRGQSLADMQQQLRQQEANQLDDIQTKSDAARQSLLKEGVANFNTMEQNVDYNYQSYNATSEFAKQFAGKVLGNLGSIGSMLGGSGTAVTTPSTATLSNTDAFTMAKAANPFAAFSGYGGNSFGSSQQPVFGMTGGLSIGN